jgi:rhamnosyltransferase
MSTMHPSVGVVFITHQARQHLVACIPPVLASPLKPRTLLVNSSSGDGTVELAREMGIETLVIPRTEFNHGATRELARRVIGTDIVVMMTPDAYALSSDFLEKLVEPVRKGVAAVSYARQIPHIGAGFMESFGRTFNYPSTSELRGLEEVSQLGAYTFFCSNACAAWRNSALDEIGGFQTVLTHEDALAAAQLIARGHRVAYVSEAVVRHSHRYTLIAEFRRYFDAGYARRAMSSALLGQRDERHGKKFVANLFNQIGRDRPWLAPYAICNISARWLGYNVGKYGHHLPLWLAQHLSGQDFYWTSRFAIARTPDFGSGTGVVAGSDVPAGSRQI